MDRLTRRQALSMAVGALAHGWVRAARARAQAPSAPARLFDIERAADGVYLALARPAVLLNCNAAIFVNARDILVVDAHSKPSAVAALVAQIRAEVSPKPVRYIVNTHFHWDHTQGMPAWRTLAPDAEVLASETTRRLIQELGAPRARAMVDARRQELESLRQKRAAARDAAERAYYDRAVPETEAFVGELENYQPDLPTITFDDRLVLHDPAHELHLVFRGRAHTASDVSVFCPQKRVIATGDLLHGFVPGMGDGFPLEWPGTLSRLADLGWTQVLPGHGGLQQGRARLNQVTAYLEEVNERVARGKQAGKTLAILQTEITPATLASMTKTEYGAYVAATLERFTLRPPEITGAVAVVTAVRANVAEVYRSV